MAKLRGTDGDFCSSSPDEGEKDHSQFVDAILAVAIGIDRLHQRRYRWKRQG